MKAITFLLALSISASGFAQHHHSLSRGTVYGSKPNDAATIKAENLEAYMSKKARISTTISGRITRVTKSKGGWFDIDAGHGKIIAAHFRDYKVTIPDDLKGKYVLAEGVAEKQFIADDGQHLAGGDKQHGSKANAKQHLIFEVTGLMVEK